MRSCGGIGSGTSDAVTTHQTMTHDRATLGASCPHFIVRTYRESVNYYRDKLGFEVILEVPDSDPYFAVVKRDDASIALKEVASDVPPLPNHERHEWARWDVFVGVDDPDALYEEFVRKGVTVHRPLANTEEGLRAFEVLDHDGYVLCFGRALG